MCRCVATIWLLQSWLPTPKLRKGLRGVVSSKFLIVCDGFPLHEKSSPENMALDYYYWSCRVTGCRPFLRPFSRRHLVYDRVGLHACPSFSSWIRYVCLRHVRMYVKNRMHGICWHHVCIYIYIYILHMYIYIYIYTHTRISIDIYIERERDTHI